MTPRRATRRTALTVLAVAAALVLASCGGQSQTIYDRTNATRAWLHIRQLPQDGALNAKAQQQAQAMAARGGLFHSTLSWGVPGGWSALGENVGVGPSADAVYDAWLRSGPHYANIANGRFSRMGIGVAVDGYGRVWAVQEFWG